MLWAQPVILCPHWVIRDLHPRPRPYYYCGMNRFVLIDFSKENRHGYKVDQGTFNMDAFRKNPVLLFMHERGQVMGRWTDFKQDNQTITAVPVFDGKDPAAMVLKGKVERGFIKAASVRFDYRSAEIKKDVLYHGEVIEVSLVDIPSYRETLTLENCCYYNSINGLIMDMKEEEKKDREPENSPPGHNELEKENAALKNAMVNRILRAGGQPGDEVRKKAYMSLSVEDLLKLDAENKTAQEQDTANAAVPPANAKDTAVLEGINHLVNALGKGRTVPEKGYHDYTAEELEELQLNAPGQFEKLINGYTTKKS